MAERTPAEAVSSAVDAGAKEAIIVDKFRCENGTLLKLKKVSRQAVIAGMTAISIPKIPRTYVKELEREEENPDHPEYLQAMRDYNVKIGEVTNAIYLGMGTEVIELGSGVCGVDSEEWSDELGEYIKVSIPAPGKKSRYVEWLKLYCLNNTDWNELWPLITKVSDTLVPQDGVASAIESFRSDNLRGERSGD